MRRAIRIGSVVTLLAFAVALVVLLIPRPCAPATQGSRFVLCFPTNVVEGILVALLGAALSTMVGLAGLIHSLNARRHGYALVLGIGLLATVPGVVLAIAGMLAMRPIPVNETIALQALLVLLAIIVGPLLAILTLLYSVASAPRELTSAEKAE